MQGSLRLSALAEQLQDEVSGLRLVPFESIVGIFQRIVRDLARDTEKHVQFLVEGSSVEIDKAVLDALKDPLMHLIRNAVDHGIETPPLRAMAGKPETGRIVLTLSQRGSEIVIQVQDDGRGIDATAVRRSAVSRGLLTATEAESLSDEDARTYIFYAGLSTSAEVTTISGRGMGMDIVRDRVESLRGRVSVQSTVGFGTTITLNVPVSLTRIRCVLLHVGDQRFAVPSAMVMRMDTVSRDTIFTAEGRQMIRLTERPMPLVSLGAVLEVPSRAAAESEAVKVVALQATDRVIAFEVDDLESEIELVLKPLGPELARARYISGAALLGSGEIIIVLDTNDLVRRALGGSLSERRRTAMINPPAISDRMRVLVVGDSITTRTLEKNILETAGFEVHTAMDGVEAWALLPQIPFDVIISDIEMPNMNGLELCAKVKSSGRFQSIPVILLTSLAKPEQREDGLRAGADAYLVKSRFDQGELLRTIQSVVG
jgi:two-component system chemotaxis sensor kinase CheA